MQPNFKRIVLLVLFVLLLFVFGATYFSAQRARATLTSLMHKDAVSLANIFAEGARKIYELQSYEVAQIRFRLKTEATRIQHSGMRWKHLPPDVALALKIDNNFTLIDTFGAISARHSQWIALIPTLLAPIVEGEEPEMFFGLDTEFPVGSEPMGFARRIDDNAIIVLFANRPFPRSVGIGLLARQLAETPSVRYIILQNSRGIIVASKDVYRATSIESDAFLKDVIETDCPKSRFIRFEGERVFELAFPFPTLGEFSGVLRIGLPLSEYSELSGIVLWTIIIGIFLAMTTVTAGIALLNIVSRMMLLRQERQELAHLESLGQVAASVAHEIRNPLNAVGISLQRLAAEFTPTDDRDEYDEIISSARRQISRIDGIVREFIAVAGSISPVRTMVDTKALIEQICRNFQPIARSRNLKLECDIGNITTANWDVEKIHRAVDNIIKNAIEASPKNAKVKILAKEKEGKIFIEIFNKGSKIPEDKLERIFEPFISGKSGGTGVGLFYAYRIVDAHGGKISVQNTTDGVKFTIEIPKNIS